MQIIQSSEYLDNKVKLNTYCNNYSASVNREYQNQIFQIQLECWIQTLPDLWNQILLEFMWHFVTSDATET